MPHVGKRSRSRDRHHRDSRDGREGGGREDRGSNQRDRDRHSRGNRDKEHERSSSRQHKRKSRRRSRSRTPSRPKSSKRKHRTPSSGSDDSDPRMDSTTLFGELVRNHGESAKSALRRKNKHKKRKRKRDSSSSTSSSDEARPSGSIGNMPILPPSSSSQLINIPMPCPPPVPNFYYQPPTMIGGVRPLPPPPAGLNFSIPPPPIPPINSGDMQIPMPPQPFDHPPGMGMPPLQPPGPPPIQLAVPPQFSSHPPSLSTSSPPWHHQPQQQQQQQQQHVQNQNMQQPPTPLGIMPMPPSLPSTPVSAIPSRVPITQLPLPPVVPELPARRVPQPVVCNKSKPYRMDDHEWGSNFVDKYDLLEQVGEGTYGQVYKARDPSTQERVALKKVRLENEKEGFPITAVREIKILRNLDHKNIVKLIDIVTDKASYEALRSERVNFYLVFEYVDHDLMGLLESRDLVSFTDQQVGVLFRQLVDGIKYAHEQNFLHRDIKCSNILVNNRGELKIADFGLARRFYADQQRPYTNRVITLWYRPPELLLGEEHYGPAIDVWSVGCILGEFFVRKPLFMGSNELMQLELISKVCGTPGPENWQGVDQLSLFKTLRPKISYPRKLKEDYLAIMPSLAVDLMDKMLILDPSRRITAADALNHPWFRSFDPSRVPPLKLPENQDCHEMWSKRQKKERDRVRQATAAQNTHNSNNSSSHQQSHQQHPPQPNAALPVPGVPPGPPAVVLQRQLSAHSVGGHPVGHSARPHSSHSHNQPQLVPPPHPSTVWRQ
ncbi:hypothetical protein WR25_24672 [Diploscapter pachys]|uniref:Cyclin-dependent kinase 12 n=1 Tax=Diploscapter pachys TaxID=2018661 RepID=A0A2A2LMW2_9BILA|nr:hypothetical protein WR25_24672 [Diploscapter pachys]